METIRALGDRFTTVSYKFSRRYRCRFQEFVYRTGNLYLSWLGLLAPECHLSPSRDRSEAQGTDAQTTPSQRIPRGFFERLRSIKNVALSETSRKTSPSWLFLIDAASIKTPKIHIDLVKVPL